MISKYKNLVSILSNYYEITLLEFNVLKIKMSSENPNGWSIYAGNGTYSGEFIYWPLTALGVFGFFNNLFVIVVLYPTQNTAHLTILKSLASADFIQNLTILGLINFPVTYNVPVNIFGDFICCVFLSSYLAFALFATSAWHVVWLTLDIYGGEGNYEWHFFLFGSKLRTRLSLIIPWVSGFLIMNNSLWNFYVDPKSQTCFLTWRSDILRFMLGSEELVLIIVLPLGIMLWCYFSLLKRIYNAKTFYLIKTDTIQSSDNQALYNAAKKLLVSLSFQTSFLLLVYLMSWLPNQIIWQLYVFKIAEAAVFETWYGKTAQVLPFISAALNPIIYGWSCYEFRETARGRFLYFSRYESIA